MNLSLAYVKYSTSHFDMSWGYGLLFIITLFLWVLLWYGYKNNRIYDEERKEEKEKRIRSKIEKSKRVSKLYPK